MVNSYELPYDPSDINWSSADGASIYTRNGGSNQKYLQEKIASLEGGEDCVVLASGVAALSGLFFALLKTGDHVFFKLKIWKYPAEIIVYALPELQENAPSAEISPGLMLLCRLWLDLLLQVRS